MVRDRTPGVARGFATGYFLHGPGGVNKCYTVLGELERLQANYRLSNSRMSGHGLLDTLKAYPDSVHVLEDGRWNGRMVLLEEALADETARPLFPVN
jgi:hypothetical protein